MQSQLVVSVLVACLVMTAHGQLTDSVDEMLNWCLDGKHHKSRPGPEDKLHQFVRLIAVNHIHDLYSSIRI